MKSLLILLLGSFFILLFFPQRAIAQFCYAESEWTFDPPPLPDGTYDAGTTVEICVEITNYMDDGNKLQGMELRLPEGWDMSSINVVSDPVSCDIYGDWVFLDSVNCGSATFGPGFYFDRDQGSGLDGVPCNNMGDFCSGPTNWQFCIEATLLGDCGGADLPLAHSDIMPGIHLISQIEIGSNSNGNSCGFELVVHPGLPELTFNCCDANSGVSPGTIYACGDQPFNLYDLLIAPKDPGGIWTYSGFGYWTDASGVNGLGTFDPLSDPLGDYTYTVAGSGGCENYSTIEVAVIDDGIVQDVVICSPGGGDLSELVTNVPVPENVAWYDIGYPEIQNPLPGGYYDPSVNPPGVYTAVYTNSSGCLSSFQILITTDVNLTAGTDISMSVCDYPDLFCPFDILHDQQPNQENNPIVEGGNWLLFDEDGTYLDVFMNWDVCLTANMLEQYGDSLEFKYALGTAPCEPVFTSLNFRLLETEFFYTASVCPATSYILTDLFPVPVPMGGVWLDSNGVLLVNFYIPGMFPPGTVQTFYYVIASETCVTTYTLELHIGGGAGDDIMVDLCGDGSTLDLNTLLSSDATPGGSWNGGPEIVLDPGNSGDYIYTVSDSSCSDTVSVYTLNIAPQISVSNIQVVCSASQTDYTVSFTISGGVGPYIVDGMPVGSSYTSAPISLPDPMGYSFSVDDGGSCGPIAVSGIAPNCSCPVTAAFASGNQTICVGSSVDLELSLNGSWPGSYDVVFVGGIGGNLTGLSDGALITLSPTTTTTYTLVSVTDGNCVGTAIGSVTITVEPAANAGPDVALTLCADGEMVDLNDYIDLSASQDGVWNSGSIIAMEANSGVYSYVVQGTVCPDDVAIYTINFVEGPTVTSVNADCSGDPTEYIVSFEINGGVPPYQVDGGGTLTGNIFVSDPISVVVGEATFTVTDIGTCAAVEVSASVEDTDGDGVCDAGEITGCQDPEAANYNPLATDPGNCFYEAGAPQIHLDEIIWTDENPGGGIVGGQSDDGAKVIQVQIFPNPAMNYKVSIEIKGMDRSVGELELKILDVLGNIRFEKEIQAQSGYAVEKVSIEGFSSGVYLVHVISGEEVGVTKLVVN